MGLFNSFVSREQSPNHHALDPTALREALACLPGSKFQLGEFLCSVESTPCLLGHTRLCQVWSLKRGENGKKRKEKKSKEKKRKEKTPPFAVVLMRSQVLYQAAQEVWSFTNGAGKSVAALQSRDVFFLMLAHLLKWQLEWSSNLLGQMSSDCKLALAMSSDC